MQQVKLVLVQTFGNRLQADLAKATLESAGIQTMIQADTVGGMREHLAWSGGGFKIFVREEDATEARDVLMSPADVLDEEPDDLGTEDDTWPPFRRFT